MIVFVLLPVKSSRSPFGIRALVLLLFIIYDCKNVRYFFFDGSFWITKRFKYWLNSWSMKQIWKKLRQSRKIAECNNCLQLAKVIKIKSKKNKTGLICFILFLVKQRLEWIRSICALVMFLYLFYIYYLPKWYISDLHIYFRCFFESYSKLFKSKSIACIPGLWNKASTYVLHSM